VDAVSSLETALGAELLRADMLGAARPRIADRYVVSAFLGRGATGLVVAAYDETLARKVALKLSPVGASNTIAEEARALARLDHANVVRVFDATAADVTLAGTTFRLWAISMELVEGTTFRAWLRSASRTPAAIVGVMLDAGAGLAAAHAQRIVHRDFKPENVLVRTDGVAQVIDFGFAIPQHSSVALGSDVAGTAPYLAPEARAGYATARSDQFAFGITLVDALTGDPSPPGHAAPTGIEPRLWAVARRASHPDARKRFADVNALLKALRSAAKRRWGCAAYAFASLAAACLLCMASWPALEMYGTYRCAPIAGQWNFRTHVDTREAGGVAVGTEGIYEMVLTHQGNCRFQVRLVQLGDDGPPPRGVVRYRTPIVQFDHADVQAGVLPATPIILSLLEAGRDHTRSYRLVFPADQEMRGTFRMEENSGRILSVSRFDPDAGHDRRRTE
jgi:serine/threonine protein kinase